jgi:uncharacterized membrane protein YedE/YeeE
MPPADTVDPAVQRASVIVAAIAGLVFGAGLVLSGMTQQAKVLGFLDVVSGAWDPSLAFVMVGAIGVHGLLRRIIAAHPRWSRRPLFSEAYQEPAKTPVDRRLVVGAAVFGVGWGLAGVCPGPALVSSSSLAPTLLLFAVGLLVGFVVYAGTFGRGR